MPLRQPSLRNKSPKKEKYDEEMDDEEEKEEVSIAEENSEEIIDTAVRKKPAAKARKGISKTPKVGEKRIRKASSKKRKADESESE